MSDEDIDRLQEVIASAYQVIGLLADRLGAFESDEITKVLDVLSDPLGDRREICPFALPSHYAAKVGREEW